MRIYNNRGCNTINFKGNQININVLKEILSLLENQETTDKDKRGGYEWLGDFGKYDYSIRKDDTIILNVIYIN